MTIGIAAAGAGAGTAILAALAAVEAIGTGAIGGFVSLAAIHAGRIERAEVQTGGTKALFSGGPPDWLQATACAVLMSSGPDRPAPLAQFTPGDALAGLVTGHRFPNMPDRDGQPLNLATLALMRDGIAPQVAVEQIAIANPGSDAGLLAITPDGRIGLRDCAYLNQFPDRGSAILPGPAGIVAVTHNGIAPWRGLALVAAEFGLSRLDLPNANLRRIEIRAGIPLRSGPRNAVEVGENGDAVGLQVSNPSLLTGLKSFGLGYQAGVIGATGHYLKYEPYMVSENGILLSIDGATIAWLAIAGSLN